jgi:AbrB family looped-hinge helix DNA binding protein
MTTATITSKGQITIPASVRQDLHIGPGDRLEFVRLAEGRYEVVAATNDASCIKGMIKTSKIVSIEEMDNAIREKAGQ